MFQSIIFGPSSGVGESILLKFDKNKYGIIDSYINKATNNPQVLDYIQEQGIAPESIDFVLLTHGHQDHYRGIAKILEACPNARFFSSNTFNSFFFRRLVSAYLQIKSRNNFLTEIVDIFSILRKTNRFLNALSSKSEPIVDNGNVKIFALSPNVHTNKYLDIIYKKTMREYLNRDSEKFKLGYGFNFQSVVLVVQIGDLQILYGADLVYHETNDNIGWTPICQDTDFQNYQFDLFKVPHHGSKTGFDENHWKAFLKEKSILKLTPYSRGKEKLPSKKMIGKMLMISSDSCITSNLDEKYKEHPLQKKLRKGHRKLSYSHGEINVTSNKKGKLQVTLSGNAVPLSKL